MDLNFDMWIRNQEITGSNLGKNLLGSAGKAIDYERMNHCINFNCYACYYFPFAKGLFKELNHLSDLGLGRFVAMQG